MNDFDLSYLRLDEKRRLHVNYDYLEPYKDDVLRFLDGEDKLKTLRFAKRAMMSQEIKANNTIEGIADDLSLIDEVIKNKATLSEIERKRIINLYHGYQYILTHSDINKESLRELYSLLSDDILSSYDQKSLGEYYRTKPVYIIKGNNLGNDYYEGVNPENIDNYMNNLFEYINSSFLSDTEINSFIKSQIMHFYFVHIHPYPDVNGSLVKNATYPHNAYKLGFSN